MTYYKAVGLAGVLMFAVNCSSNKSSAGAVLPLDAGSLNLCDGSILSFSDAGSGSCTFVQNTAPIIQTSTAIGPMPVGTGGTIVPGEYWVVGDLLWAQQQASTNGAPEVSTAQIRLTSTPGVLEFDDFQVYTTDCVGNDPVYSNNHLVVEDGGAMTIPQLCPSDPTNASLVTGSYTSTTTDAGTTLILYWLYVGATATQYQNEQVTYSLQTPY